MGWQTLLLDMFTQYTTIALAFYGVSGNVIFEDNDKSEATSFLRAKRSPNWLTGWLGTQSPDSTGASAYVTTPAQNCRTLKEGEKLVLRNIAIAENDGIHCYSQWEEYTDKLEQNEGLKKGFREEYDELDECVDKCKRKIRFNSCKRAQKDFQNNPGAKMRQFCKQCIQHIPIHYDVEDTKMGVREKLSAGKKVVKVLGPALTGGNKKSGDLTVGGINVQGALDEGLSMLGGLFGGATSKTSDLSNGDQVCEGVHEAYKESFFYDYLGN